VQHPKNFVKIYADMEEFEVRRQKIEELRERGIEPYPYRFEKTHRSSDVKSRFDELKGMTVRLAGRLISKRVFGKLIFAHIQDEDDRIQLIFQKNVTKIGETDEDAIKFVKKDIDVGDIIGAEGEPFLTKTGEKSLLVHRVFLLAKGLRPLPEKWHGLRDREVQYRQRYLDLIVNPESREFFKLRARVISEIRKFFEANGFIEFETPTLQPIYGGAYARPFETFAHALDTKLYLRISDELYLKRLLVGGYERVFEICKDFRNEGIDRFHYPEFTMLEAYAAYWDYNDMMELTEKLFLHLVQSFSEDGKLRFDGKEVDVKPPFPRIRFVDSLAEKLGYDPLDATQERLAESAKVHGLERAERMPKHKLIDKLFDRLVGDHLIEPTFVIDHPAIISPLAKRHRQDPRLVERFELYMFGIELANAFSELNDPIDQRQRFEALAALKAQDEEIPSEIDEDFLTALEYGMPPAGGIGIGIDRLIMVVLDRSAIRDVILFPQLRPKLSPSSKGSTSKDA